MVLWSCLRNRRDRKLLRCQVAQRYGTVYVLVCLYLMRCRGLVIPSSFLHMNAGFTCMGRRDSECTIMCQRFLLIVPHGPGLRMSKQSCRSKTSVRASTCWTWLRLLCLFRQQSWHGPGNASSRFLVSHIWRCISLSLKMRVVSWKMSHRSPTADIAEGYSQIESPWKTLLLQLCFVEAWFQEKKQANASSTTWYLRTRPLPLY